MFITVRRKALKRFFIIAVIFLCCVFCLGNLVTGNLQIKHIFGMEDASSFPFQDSGQKRMIEEGYDVTQSVFMNLDSKENTETIEVAEEISPEEQEGSPEEQAVPKDSKQEPQEKKYIKWVEFNVPYSALEKAMNLDIKSAKKEVKLNWIEILAYLGAKNGGNFEKYKASDIDKIVKRLENGERMEDITKDMKYYSYYYEAYSSVLTEFLGEYEVISDKTEEPETKYGLKVFSPIAKGYSFSHYDDFGVNRSYGYKRKHLGNDLLGSIGTPIIAVEGGTIEAMGWNPYGGWRIGIRSFDKKRYYYYAHLRKNKPFNPELKEGDTVSAGQLIGYLGMTGYSTKENTNNIQTPHLHFGMQLIFDESQKEGTNQIWIDVYNIIKLLNKNKAVIPKGN